MRTSSPARDLALAAVFAALLAALSLTPAIPLGSIGVPITLQTLGVLLCGLILGPWRGALTVVLYIVVGLAGLPVFSGGGAGIGHLAKPSVGYLLSFPLAALAAGWLSRFFVRAGRKPLVAWLFVATLAGIVLNHVCGIAGMMATLKIDLARAAVADAAFLPGDLVKGGVAAAIAVVVHRAFPWLKGGDRA